MSDFIDQSSIENVESNYQHLFHFSGANKAGMQGIDKDKQAKVIYECSKNSNYFKRALEQDKKIDEKVAKMQLKLKSFNEPQLLQIKSKISKEVNDIELKRDFSRLTTYHV
jgi:DNA polymerase kappa